MHKKELAADYFERHQISNECHITSDNRVFHTSGTAEGFATTLKDSKVVSFTRSEVEKGDESRVLTLEDFDGFDATVANYPEAKELVKKLGLKPISQKLPDLLAIIAAELEKLQD
jgi:hypothetical protein